eukprot:gene3251-3564_t
MANKQKKRSSNKVSGLQATINLVLDWLDSVVFQPILNWVRVVVFAAGVGFSVSRVSEASSAPINTNGKVMPAVDFGQRLSILSGLSTVVPGVKSINNANDRDIRGSVASVGTRVVMTGQVMVFKSTVKVVPAIEIRPTESA